MLTRMDNRFEVAESGSRPQHPARHTLTVSPRFAPARRGAASKPSVLPDRHLILELQRQAGNAAIVAALRDDRIAVQRCGDHACPPTGCTPEAKEAALEEHPTSEVQRFWPFDSEDEAERVGSGGTSGGGGSTDDYAAPDAGPPKGPTDAGLPGGAPKQTTPEPAGASDDDENASFDDEPNQSLARPWKCSSSCNVEGKEPQCTGRVTGSGEGPTEDAACRSAKRDATQKAPRGCYARHCQCDCSQ
jgi:hypothetical protein